MLAKPAAWIVFLLLLAAAVVLLTVVIAPADMCDHALAAGSDLCKR